LKTCFILIIDFCKMAKCTKFAVMPADAGIS
jgi:hypothetical protein